MYREYDELFSSLFDDKDGVYKAIIELLCTKKSGFSLSEIAKRSDIKLGVKLKTAVAELEECGFIRGVAKYGNTVREVNYMIIDPYILFHHKWIKDLSRNNIANLPNNYWTQKATTQAYAVWSGYAFEMVSMINIPLYLKARGRSDFYSGVYYWQQEPKEEGERGAQIDMVVNYGNGIFDIVECKYYSDEYVITKEYAENLKNKMAMFRKYGLSRKRSELRLVFLTTYGLKPNAQFHNLNVGSMVLDDLLE
ncbi:MAG TPA: hypothetical protein ENK91_11105 [Bacteroidetes bacterium]|nr:hypothetical protein [Bacteroidota bacterium]